MLRKLSFLVLLAALVVAASHGVRAQDGAGPDITVYLVRNGETVLDSAERIQGVADSPLSRAGVETVTNTAFGLRDVDFNLVFSSDRMRNSETAAIIVEENAASIWQAPLELDGLREISFGEKEGELENEVWAELVKQTGKADKKAVLTPDGLRVLYPAIIAMGGELGAKDDGDPAKRYQDAMSAILERASVRGGGNILVSADELAIRSILAAADPARTGDVPPGSVSIVRYTNGKPAVAAMGDVSYTESGAKGTARTNDGEVVVYLIRHGRTIFNTVSRVQGWTDTPLTASGREVAENLGKGLSDISFSAVYTSDLRRTVETAQLVLKHSDFSSWRKIHKVPGLRETFYGGYDGGWNEDMNQVSYAKYGVGTWEELSSLDHSARKILTAVSEADETGEAESYEEMSSRVSGALRGIVEEEAEKGGGNVLIVSHGHAIMGIMDKVGGVDVTSVANSAVCKLVYKDGTYSVESVNDKSYIEKGAARK